MSAPRAALRSIFVSRTAAITVGALMLIAAGTLSYLLAERAALRNQGSAAQERLNLLASTLDYTIGRYSYLPDVLSQAAPIIEAFRHPENPDAIGAANLYLKRLNETADSADLYIVDSNGIALAASNFDRENTFVGQSYAFPPVFHRRIDHREGALLRRGRDDRPAGLLPVARGAGCRRQYNWGRGGEDRPQCTCRTTGAARAMSSPWSTTTR
jgi:hypothetical protein